MYIYAGGLMVFGDFSFIILFDPKKVGKVFWIFRLFKISKFFEEMKNFLLPL